MGTKKTAAGDKGKARKVKDLAVKNRSARGVKGGAYKEPGKLEIPNLKLTT